MTQTRCSFLQSGLVTAAAGVLASFPIIMPRQSLGQVEWGSVPSGILPSGYQPKSILEIHCYGAPSAWAPSSASRPGGTRPPRGGLGVSGGGAGQEKGVSNSYPLTSFVGFSVTAYRITSSPGTGETEGRR